MVIMVLVVLIICYNGASFYVKVIDHGDYNHEGKLNSNSNIKKKG